MSQTIATAYEKTEIGQIGRIRLETGVDGEHFQAEVKLAYKYEDDGMIEVMQEHKESETGKRYVDLLLFRRLK